MKSRLPVLFALVALLVTSTSTRAAAPAAPAPSYPRPLVDLNTGYFPFHDIGPITPESWGKRKQEIRDRVLLAGGLYPLPTKTPLNAIIHGRVERDDYTVDRVIFESFPGHYVTGNLYLPKNPPKGGKMPGILSAHGHWPKGRFTDYGEGPNPTWKQQIAIGAERWESGARMPLHARCVQLARMGCAVLFYDMTGNGDSVQLSEHRPGRRPELNGTAPGTFGFASAAADARLESNFGLQTWNSIRALDFLLTVPGVDPARLAITGESGGGTQTLMLSAIDDRLAASFPCVMTSTGMQGGCTCENACYLRINQGNVDIAAAFAPKPMGMTAANDWTKELEKKGFPDLKKVWTSLGHPNDILATFNIHWQHNYNHVSRTTMYGFMNKHFNLGFTEPVLERDFVLLTPAEMTVWTGAHPAPTGDKVGPAHEKALLKYWSDDSDKKIAGHPEIIAHAWEMMIGRTTPGAGDAQVERSAKSTSGDYTAVKGTIHDTRDHEDVPFVFAVTKEDQNRDTGVLWLTEHGVESLTTADGKSPSAAVRKVLDTGIGVASLSLYLPGATEQPMNPVKNKDASRNDWSWAACYTYGYNPSLIAHRVHDVMSAVAAIRAEAKTKRTKIILAGSDGAGVVAAAAALMLKDQIDGLVIDTEGFRFASLTDQWSPQFVPGAVKYGDVPGLLSACASLKPIVLGENGAKGGAEAVAAAVVKLAGR